MTSRRYRWAGVALAVTAVLGSAACAPSTTPTPAPAASSGSASATVRPLTAPGAARAAIDHDHLYDGLDRDGLADHWNRALERIDNDAL